MTAAADDSAETAPSTEDAENSLERSEATAGTKKRGRARGKGKPPAQAEAASLPESEGSPSERPHEGGATPGSGDVVEASDPSPSETEESPEASVEPSDAEIEAAALAAEADDPEAMLASDAVATENIENLDEIAVDAESPGEVVVEGEAEPSRTLGDIELAQAVEAMLFATSEPLTHARLAQVLKVTQRRVRIAIERLREEYQSTNRAFDVREIAGGYKLYTRPEHDEIVARLEKVKPPEKLTAAGLETLAIIAYKQPITRAEIDAIRGVQSGAMLKSLTEKKLIRVAGRSPQPGRPIQYGTTKRFLDHFGLASVEDLPRVEDLKAP